jgi:hypothetical protein
MGVLQPALLFLGIAAAIPIILHLFQRHQGPRVVFPALRYLRRAEKESARQIRLRQLLLMLLRVATVLLVAFAAARPFLRAAGAEHEPAAIAIVLDNSLSTGIVVEDRRVLDDLKDRALETLAQAGPDDRFWLIRAGAPWEPAIPGDALSLAERVRETEPTAAAADLGAALAHARALLATGADGRAAEIQLLSDLQATSLGSTEALTGGGPPLVVWLARGDPPRNAWVADVTVGGGLAPIAGERANVTASVQGEGTADSVTIRLTVEDRIVAAALAPIGSSAVLGLPARNAGWITGSAETDPDPLRADDRRFFAVRVLPPPTVATSAPLRFVDDALSVMELAGRLRRTALSEATVGILPSALGLESFPASRVALILPPASVLELPAANRRLSVAGIPWRYDAPSGAGESRFDVQSGTDELLRVLEPVRLTQVFALRSQSGTARADSVLLRLRDGSAWAIRGERPGGGRYVILASSLSDSATTLPTSAAMLPLLDRLVGSWSAELHDHFDVAPGSEIPLPASADALLGPDDVREPVQPNTSYRLGGTPGIYRVLAGDSLITAFAVNPPAAESQLERLSRRDFEGALSGWNVHTANSAGDWGRTIYQRRLGSEFWRLLLALAVLVLALEAIVAASGRARHTTTESAAPQQTPPSEPSPIAEVGAKR